MARFIFFHDCEDCAFYKECSKIEDLPTDCEDFEYRSDL